MAANDNDHALDATVPTGPDGLPITTQFADVIHFIGWIDVLARPQIWNKLPRIPPKEHLMRLADAYRVHAYSKRWYTHLLPDEPPPDPAIRGPAADHFRAVVDLWEPPVLTTELCDAARAVMASEFPRCAREVPNWNREPDDADLPTEQTLLWPEGTWNDYLRSMG